MSSKNEYPKMLYRSDEKHGARPVFGKDGVFYATVADAQTEAAAIGKGYRASVRAPQAAPKVEPPKVEAPVVVAAPKPPKAPKAPKPAQP